MRPTKQVEVAGWLSRSGVSWDQVVLFGPGDMEAYARLRYIPDPGRPGMLETDAELESGHPSDLAQACTAISTLLSVARSSQDCFMCFWDGEIRPHRLLELTGLPRVVLPHREYVLYTGPPPGRPQDLQELCDSITGLPPAFFWPADHSWCFASDVDPTWAGVGASTAAITTLMSTPGLDVVPASPRIPPLNHL